MKFKVMTFNIQHGRNHNYEGDVIDLALMAETIRNQNASIVSINEVRCGVDPDHSSGLSNQPSFFAETLGGECRFGKAINIYDSCGYGNAIFSKYPILNFEIIAIPDVTERIDGFYESRCIIRTDYNIDGKKLTVLNSYFGLGVGESENAVETVFSVASAIDNPIILMGDFNLTPDNTNIKRLSKYFTDVHSVLYKEELTFPSHSPKIRIDYIFTRGLEPISAETVKIIASDHYPITAELEI